MAEGDIQCANHFEAFGSFKDRKGYCGRVIGPKLVKSLHVKDCERRKASCRAFLSTTTGDVFKADHTHWGTKYIRDNHQRLFTAQYGIMNEIGEIVGTVFTQTKSLRDPAVARLMSKVLLRYCRRVYPNVVMSNNERLLSPPLYLPFMVADTR